MMSFDINDANISNNDEGQVLGVQWVEHYHLTSTSSKLDKVWNDVTSEHQRLKKSRTLILNIDSYLNCTFCMLFSINLLCYIMRKTYYIALSDPSILIAFLEKSSKMELLDLWKKDNKAIPYIEQKPRKTYFRCS